MAVSDQEVFQYVKDLEAQGLSGLELEKAINNAAKQYGVGDAQLSRTLGLNQAQIDTWRNKNAPAPLQPADALGEAMAGTRNVMSYAPQQVQAQQAAAQGYTPQTIAGQDMSAYMNPYTQQVIDQSMADLERQRQMQTNNLGFSATQAGAFGGSRHGVAEALTNEGFARQGGQLAANLRNQGYGQALQTAGQDVGFMNQAGQFGAAAQNAASLANAGFGMQAGLANQNAGLQGAQLNLSAANQMGNLGNLGFTQMNTLNNTAFNQGLAQQQMNQNIINNAMQQYAMWQGMPSTSLGYFGEGLGGVGGGSQSTTNPNYSFADQIGQGINLWNSITPFFG